MTKEHDGVQSDKIQANTDRIAWLETHYSTFNSEMGCVKTDVNWLKIAVQDVKRGLEEINNKIMWGFVFTIGLSILAQIILKFYTE